MTASIKFSLPYYLRQSLKALAEVDSSVVGSAPNIIICSSDGYIYELKAGKIVNSLNLKGEIGNRIFPAYLVEYEKLLIFYLVLTVSNKLLIIKRLDSYLEITKTYENVNDFEVFDFKCLGYPQIKLKFSTLESDLVGFPIDDTDAVVEELEFETNSDAVAQYLAKNLQIVCRHVDGLIEKLSSLRKLCQFNNNTDFGLLPIDFVKFSKPFENCSGKIIVTAKWIKIVGGKIVLGMKICNNGEEVISDLEFEMYEKMIRDYSYRFFSSNDENDDLLFSSKMINASIQPGLEITVAGAVSICLFNFSFRTKLQISCYLSSGKLKNHLLKETFEISVSDVIEYGNKFFSTLKEACSVEDLQAIRTVKLETKLKIKTKNVGFETMAKIMKENLGFIEVQNLKNKLYYSISTYWNEVFVALLPVAVNETVWKIILFTSDEAQISFLVNLFYELLPEYTTILLDED